MQAAVLDPFSANYLRRSWDAYDARAEKREESGVDTAVTEKISTPEQVEAAFAAYRVEKPNPTPEQAWIYEAYEACLAKTSTPEQARLVKNIDDRAHFEDFDRQRQSSRDRIQDRGYVWDGWRLAPDVIGSNGISLKYDVGGHLHLPFVVHDLPSRTSGSPLMLRCLTMTAKPVRGIKANPKKKIAHRDAVGPRTGMTKDGCKRQRRKIVAYDNLYWFFNDHCVDAWRHDDDDTYPSEAHLGAWLDHEVEEGRLAAKPNKSVYVWDDRWPEKVPTPHHYYFLPDDGGKPGGKDGKTAGKGSSAVWKDPFSHHMLSQIQAKLNEQLGCDPGGLANMNHGKNPLSTHVITINWHENCLTLSEFAELLDLDLTRQEMARKQSVDRLKAVGFDDASSNNSFTVVSTLALDGTRHIGRDGNIDTNDYDEFLTAAIEEATVAVKRQLVEDGIKPTQEQWAALEGLIDTCCKWAVADFDPKKLTKSGLNPGAAAHLMLPTDDTKTRIRKGQRYSADAKAAHSKKLIGEAIASIKTDGAEETVSEIARRAGRSRDTVRRHMFAAHVAKIAIEMLAAATKTHGYENTEIPASRVAIEPHVWGASVYSAAFQPSPFVLAYARQRSDLPISWLKVATGIDWNEKQAKLAQSERLKRERSERRKANRHPVSGPPAGRNTIDFLESGKIKVFRSSSGRQRAA